MADHQVLERNRKTAKRLIDGEMYPIIRRLWDYTPVPEPHVAGLVMGRALYARWPWRITRKRKLARVSGLGLIGCGVFITGWAFRSVAGNIGSEERQLVTTGPYSLSRNPMYVGWTVLYAGLALLSNNRWIALFFPAVVTDTHLGTIQEERSLEREFGDEYRTYRRTVRRYL